MLIPDGLLNWIVKGVCYNTMKKMQELSKNVHETDKLKEAMVS
jgi:hypothetical protein